MSHRIALLAEKRPWEYGQVWETFERLKLSGNAVEILDAERFEGLLDEGLEGNPRYSAFLETFRPDCIALPGETVDEIEARLASVPDTADNPRHFVIFGYVGKDNFGDELIFSIIVARLLEAYPGSYVSLIGHCPQRALERHGVVAVEPWDKAAVRALLNGASALIYMAGIMFDAPFENTTGMIDLFENPYSEISAQTAFVQLAYMCGVPAVFFGVGAGPLANPDAQRLVKLGSLCDPLYVVRDARTVELLRDAGVDARLIHEKADVAFLLDERPFLEIDPATQGLGPGGYIAVSLRDDPAAPADFCQQVAAALDAEVERGGGTALFLNFAPEDRQVHEAVVSAMRHGSDAVVVDTLDTDETLRLLAHARVVLGMRLHASVLACLFGVPCVGLNYNDKVEAFYGQMGIPDLLAPLSARAVELSSLLARAGATDLSAVARHVGANRAKAREGFSLLRSKVDGTDNPPVAQRRYPRTHSMEAQRAHEAWSKAGYFEWLANDTKARLAECEQRLAQANAERDEALERVREIESSTTWKVGRAATALPRAIKDAARRSS